MQEKIHRLNEFFASEIRACTQRAAALSADDRRDEANFEKIRANVFDIFRTVLSAAEKAGGDAAAVREFFLLKSQQIPANWEAALAEAQRHGDTEKAHIESIKLRAMEDISAAFTKIWEDCQ